MESTASERESTALLSGVHGHEWQRQCRCVELLGFEYCCPISRDVHTSNVAYTRSNTKPTITLFAEVGKSWVY